MATFWKVMAGGLLLALSLALRGSRVEAQGNGRGKKEVSGGSTVYLGQDRDIWRPLMHTTVNLSEISSIKSSFGFRTFDPEGVIFYGDTKNGDDWFVLSLKDGIPLMQISREDILVSVAGGPRINDGAWHTLEVSNQENFVILEVDGSNKLVVGMQSKRNMKVLAGKLRLAVGGILVDKSKMIVEFEPHMDGCVREGSWLNLSVPWEAEVEELWPCYQNVQPGSYFPGTGFALFNASVFLFETHHEVKIELWGDFTKMTGTILSIKAPGRQLEFALRSSNDTKEVTFFFGIEGIAMGDSFKRLTITFQTESVQVVQDESWPITLPMGEPGYLSTWRDVHVAVGGRLGEDDVVSEFLTGCLEKIRIQGRDLDLDLAARHTSISSHSCPA